MTVGNAGPPYSCDQLEEVAAELALGVLGGVERAQALAHLESCARCQAVVEEMAGVGDVLLGLSPEVEPPAGFESRLLARREASFRASRPSRRWTLVTAGVLAAAAAVTVVVSVVVPRSSGFRVQHPGAVAALGGRELAVGALRHQGADMGQVFAYTGDPSWVFMTVEAHGPPRQVDCELDLRSGATVRIGSFAVAEGYRSWGSTLHVSPSDIVGVRLVTPGGAVLASATL